MTSVVSWNSSVFKKRFQGVQETNFTVLLHILQVVEDIDSETIAEYLGDIVPGLIRVIIYTIANTVTHARACHAACA